MKRKLFLLAMLLIISVSMQAQRAYITNAHSVSVIDIPTGIEIDRIGLPGAYGVSVSPDGSKVFVTNNHYHDVSEIDVATDAVTDIQFVGNYPNGICVSPNGKRVFVASKDPDQLLAGEIDIIEPDNSNNVTNIHPLFSTPYGVCFSPNGHHVFITDTSAHAIWELDSLGNYINGITLNFTPTYIIANANGSKYYVADGTDNYIHVFDSTLAITGVIDVWDQPYGMTLNLDGSRLYVSCNRVWSTVAVVNTLNNTVIDDIAVDSYPRGLAISPDGSHVYVTNNFHGIVDLINTSTNAVESTIPVDYGSVAFGNFMSTYISPVVINIAATSDTICPGTSTTLIANGASSYSWNNGLGTSDSLVVSPSSTTTYYVIGIDSTGARGVTTHVITVKPRPNPQLTTPPNLIAKNAAAVNLNGQPLGGTYTGPGITGTVFDPLAAGLGKKTITYSFTNSFGCTWSTSRNVLVIDTIGILCHIYDTVITHLSVTDTLFIKAVLTGVSPPNNINMLKVYPNAARDHISINCGNYSTMAGYAIHIENASGQSVFTTSVNQSLYYVDLSGWTGVGAYTFYVKDNFNNTIITKKIIIQ